MEQPNYYAIIPADVRYDKNLRDKSKLLYGEIVALSNKDGECWASNKYFAELYKISITTVSTLINELIKNNYIESKISYKNDSKEIEKRYLKIFKDPYLNNFKEGIKKNLKDNNTSINNTRINNIIIVEQALEYMNKLAGTNFSSKTIKTQKLINARLKEGFSLEQIKDVIYFKYNEWYKNPITFNNGVNSATYYRPNTLFGTKFEEYLNEYNRTYT